MAIQDSDPERRNLTVTSIGFITYFYAGGSLPDTSVRLEVVNVEFSRPEVLAVIVWLAFIWFIYRYWLTHNGDFTNYFSSELTHWQGKSYIKNYASKNIGQDLVTDQDKGYHVNSLAWSGGCLNINVIYAEGIVRNANGEIGSYSSTDISNKHEPIKMSDAKGWLLALRASMECMFKYPSFSNYIVPYILSLVALAGVALRSCALIE